MLMSLNIKNYAIIDSLNIDFNEGLNVLTGETGAGKSIIIGALSFALGYRSSSEIIRSGEDKVSVKILFDFDKKDENISSLLSQNDISHEDGTLLISRELSMSGRNVCRINDTLVSVTALRDITSKLIDIHGQHEHQKLFNQESHIIFLDAYAGERILRIKENTAEAYVDMKLAEHKFKDMQLRRDEELRRKNAYKEKYEEIIKLDLKPREDEELEERVSFLANSEKIYENTDEAYKILFGNEEDIGYKLKHVAEMLSFLSKYEKTFLPAAQAIEEAAIAVDDATLQLRDYQATLDFDPYELDNLQLRMKKISDAKLKYGYTIEDILAAADECKAKLDEIDNYDVLLEETKSQYEESFKTYLEFADGLSVERKKYAEEFSAKLTKCLDELSIRNAKLEVSFQKEEKQSYREDGYDRIQFLISTNAGENLKPLSKIASGGEISRVMLAIKSILADSDNTGTLIFDEIDTGISGQTAQVVAEKMYELSVSHQIICITHLTQLASMADYHYLISKQSDGVKTYTGIKELTSAERVRALAQMLSGTELTQNSINHAEEMLNLAKNYKSNV